LEKQWSLLLEARENKTLKTLVPNYLTTLLPVVTWKIANTPKNEWIWLGGVKAKYWKWNLVSFS
jgi:hypothetical protein